MANQYYTLIETPTIEIDGKLYECKTYNTNLKQFLLGNSGKQLYIYHSSILTDKIQAIVK